MLFNYPNGLRPKEYSEKLLSDLNIDLSSKIDPFAIAEKLLGRPVTFGDTKGFNGMLLTVDNKNVIIIKNSIREEGKKRFTCAHEIGHFIIPTHKKEGIRCTEDDIETLDEKKHLEYEANEFSNELLIPTKVFKKHIEGREPSKELFDELTERFGTTLTATAFKYVQLCELSCALVISQNSQIRWFAKSEFFTPIIRPGWPVSDGTYAKNFFQGRNVPSEFSEVKAKYWVEGKGIDNYTTILELSIPQPMYDQVLTILWFEQDLEDLEDEYYEDEFNGYLKKKWRD